MQVPYHTLRDIAERYGVGLKKVLGWIASGELAAINIATRAGGQPRWRISPEAVAEFERARSSKPEPPAKPSRRTKRPDIIEFV